jgi:hypothetical protein
MALSIPSAIPAASRLPHETRSAAALASTLAASDCSAMVFDPAGLGLLLLHEDLCEIAMLLEDRHNLVDQRFYVIVAGILALLLQFADESFVIGTGLFQKEPIKSHSTRGA